MRSLELDATETFWNYKFGFGSKFHLFPTSHVHALFQIRIFLLNINDLYLNRENSLFRYGVLLSPRSFYGAFVPSLSCSFLCQYKETLKIFVSLDLSHILFFPEQEIFSNN